MNIDFYRNYIKIVEEGSLSRAARKLHIAQSALSNQLKIFEEEYNAIFFKRNTRKMELTAEGKILYDKAQDIVAIIDSAHKEIQDYKEGYEGTLRLGMTLAYPDNVMTDLLVRFHKTYPRVRYDIHEMNSSEIIELVRSGIIEIGVVRTEGMLPGDVNVLIKLQQKLCVAFKRDNPWIVPENGPILIKDLENVPLALSRSYNDVTRDIFSRCKVHPMIMSVSTSRSNTLMWCKLGAAAAIICAGETDYDFDGDIFYRPLAIEDPDVEKVLNPTRSFIVAKDKKLSIAGKDFIKFSKQNFAGAV